MIIKEDYEEDKERILNEADEAGLSDYEKAMALASYEHFDADIDEVLEGIENGEIQQSSWDSHYIEFNSLEAWVFDDYEDAESAAKEDVINTLDDIGYAGLNVDLSQFADEDWFRDALVESFEYYCRDIALEDDDTYGDRLVQECYDEGLIDDSDFEQDEDGEPDYTQCLVDTDELVERYVDWYTDNNYDWIQLYIDDFGQSSFDEVCRNNSSIIDQDALAEYIVEIDGVTNSLARYDGNECEVEIGDVTYYVYRAN